MAESQTPSLLNRLSADRLGDLPATIERPSEPTERGRSPETVPSGRRPEELIPEREVKEPAKRADDDLGERTEPAKVKRYKIRNVDGDGHSELTLEEIAAQGLMDRLVASANQLPTLSKKYQEQLEKLANAGLKGEAPAAQPAAKPAPPKPTAEQIKQVYLPMLQETVKELHMEADFAEAYPQVGTELMYFRDIIENVVEKLGNVIDWIGAEVQKRNHETVRTMLDSEIDKLAALGAGKDGDKLYASLNEPEVRANFVNYLRKDINPVVGALTHENMKRFWIGFNGEDLLKFTKEAAKKQAQPEDRRRAKSDGTPSRPGIPETPTEKGLLDRMTELRLGEAN